MQLTLDEGLPFVAIRVSHLNADLELERVLVDTGSATCVFAADALARIGIEPRLEDTLFTMYGVGGSEVVFGRQLDVLEVGGVAVEQFSVQVGALDYGTELDGILGMDFLRRVGAVIDLARMSLRFSHD